MSFDQGVVRWAHGNRISRKSTLSRLLWLIESFFRKLLSSRGRAGESLARTQPIPESLLPGPIVYPEPAQFTPAAPLTPETSSLDFRSRRPTSDPSHPLQNALTDTVDTAAKARKTEIKRRPSPPPGIAASVASKKVVHLAKLQYAPRTIPRSATIAE